MKKLFFLLLTIVFFNVSAQDVIVKRNGDELQCEVLEVSKNEVKYKRWSNLNGPTFVDEKVDILMIRYQNGEVDEFDENSTPRTGEFLTDNASGNSSSVLTKPILRFDKMSKSGLSYMDTALSIKKAKMIMGSDWDDFQMYHKKRQKGKNLIIWSVVFRVFSSGTFLIGVKSVPKSGSFEKVNPWLVTSLGLRLVSYPLMVPGIVTMVKGWRGCERLVKQHNASISRSNPEFDFGIGTNAVSLRINF